MDYTTLKFFPSHTKREKKRERERKIERERENYRVKKQNRFVQNFFYKSCALLEKGEDLLKISFTLVNNPHRKCEQCS